MQDSEASKHRQHAKDDALHARKAHTGDATQKTAKERACLPPQTEARLRSIFRAAPVGIGLVSNRTLLEVNDRMCEMVGYSQEELVGQNTRVLYPTDEDYEYVGQEKYRQIQERGTGTVETRWRRKDGAILDVLLSSAPLDPNDHGQGVTFTALDITDRKRSDAGLRESKKRFEALAEKSPNMIFINQRGQVVYVNEKCEEVMEYKREEICTEAFDFLEIIATEDRALVKEKFSQHMAGQDVDPYEYSLVNRSGKRIEAIIATKLIEYQGERAILGIVTDVTERKKAEEALRESEMRFRELAEMLPQTVFEINADGTFIFGNRAGFEAFGYTAEELVGLSILQLFAPEDRDRIQQGIQKRLTDEIVDNREYRALQKDGSTFPILVYASPIIRDGRAVGLRGIGVDITEQKKAEEERQAHLWSLESMEQVNRVIHQATDPEQMMSDVITTTSAIFDCDRTWLLYPCDPDAPSFQVPVEHTRPEYPSAFTLGTDIPMKPGGDLICVEALASGKPVTYGPDADHPVYKQLADRFGVLSMMTMAIYPKIGKPWAFGMHQCSRACVWTPAEQALFKEIGHRIADGLSSLLSLRELKESEARFRELAELLPQTIFETDAEGRFTFVSRLAFEAFGYRPDELDGRPVVDLFVPEDRERILQNIQKKLQGEPFWDHEYTARKKDRTTFPVLLYSAAIIRDGHPVGLRGIVVDITERQYAERALQESKAKLESILESSPNAIAVTDLEGNIIDCNQATLDMHGFTTKDRLLGRSAFDLIAERDRPRARANMENTLAHGLMRNVEYTLLKEDGREFPCEVSVSLMKDNSGQPMGLVVAMADITERKRTREQLAHERNLLRTLIDNLPDSTYIKDRDSRFMLCSKSLLQAAGVDATEQVVGKTDFDFYAHDVAETFYREEQELMESGEPMINRESRVCDETTGQAMWNLTTKVPLNNDEGVVIGLVGISKNITERREMEEALRASLQTSSDIVASIPSGLFIYKYEPPERLTLIAGNPAATQLTGLDVPENIGREFDVIWPQARQRGLTEQLLAVMKTGRIFETEEFTYEDDRLTGVFSLRAFSIPGDRLCIAFEDVTERRRAAEALRASQKELAAIFNSAPTTMLVVDHERRIRKANRASLGASGRPLEEIVGLRAGEALRCLHALESPDGYGFRPACQECAVCNIVLDTLATGQGHHQVEAALPIGPAGHGRERIFEVSTTPLTTLDERLALVCIDDVTERKRVVDALKKSEERYRELYEGSRDASVSVTMDGQVLDCNSAYLEMLGYTKEELCQLRFQDITPAQWHEAEETILREQLLTRGYSDVYQKEYRRKNGTVFPIELRAYLNRDRAGRPTGMWAFVRDITDRKRAEEALRESERTLATLMGNLPGMAYRCRNVPNWTMEFISEGCVNLTGYRPSELVGDQTVSYRSLIRSDERAYVWEQIQRSLKEKKRFELEYRIRTRDGKERWVWERGAGIYKESGEIAALEGFITDIAERKRAEEKLLAYQTKLKSLASELALAEERERRRIAADLHDHACQSLALSKMKLQTLLQTAHPTDTKMLQSICDTLNETLENVRELTFDLSSPILYKFGLEAALEELLKDKLRTERDITYRFSNDGKPKPLADDVLVLLYQSVRELLINVIKHSQAHEVTLDIRRERDSITIVLADDGVGFDVDEVLSFPSQRRSVGLFNTLERLDYVGGKLDMDSRRGHGSQFTLIAPLEVKTHVAKENGNGREDCTR